MWEFSFWLWLLQIKSKVWSCRVLNAVAECVTYNHHPDFFRSFCLGVVFPLSMSENGDLVFLGSKCKPGPLIFTYHQRDNIVEHSKIYHQRVWLDSTDYVQSLVLPYRNWTPPIQSSHGLSEFMLNQVSVFRTLPCHVIYIFLWFCSFTCIKIFELDEVIITDFSKRKFLGILFWSTKTVFLFISR